LKTLHAACLMLGLGAAAGAWAQPYSLLGGTPISMMSEKDIALYEGALKQALDAGKIGRQSSWANPETGASGTIKPKRSFKQGAQECQDVYLETKAKGRREKGTWAFCREPGGTWQLSPGASGK